MRDALLALAALYLTAGMGFATYVVSRVWDIEDRSLPRRWRLLLWLAFVAMWPIALRAVVEDDRGE